MPFSAASVKALASGLSNSKLFCGAVGDAAGALDSNIEAYDLNDPVHSVEEPPDSPDSPDGLAEKKKDVSEAALDNRSSCGCARRDNGTATTPDNDNDQQAHGHCQQHHKLPLIVAPILENTGSVARDHLANERTWLAYIRTSITISGTGIALVQLFTVTASENSTMVISAAGMDLVNLGSALPRIIRPLGCAIVLSGFGVLIMGIYRYFSVQNALQKGLFPTARSLVVLTSGVLIAFIAINFGLFLTIPD